MKSVWIFLFAFVSFSANAFDITFRLQFPGAADVVPEVNGNFNNWCGNCAAMTYNENDNVWEKVISLSAGTYEYKYSFNSWTGQEDLVPGSSCTNTTGQFTNRELVVTGDAVLPVVCWGSCDACATMTFEDWPLVWADEFEGTALNLLDWTPETGGNGWGNNEWQYYTGNEANVQVSNGTLKINAIEQVIGNNAYSSARLITNNKVELQYGRVEARIKVPLGQGIWPAFWMLGANYEDVSWPQCGEIDVMEHINNESTTYGTVHWNNNGHAHQGGSYPMDPDEFHVYGILWQESGLIFYMDSIPYFEFEFQSGNNTAAIFQQPFFLLLNVAVGGNWPGYPDGSTNFPATMEVDYVRWYQENGISVKEEVTVATWSVISVAGQLQLKGLSAQEIVTLKDISGKVVEVSQASQGFATDKLASGMYLVQAGQEVRKVMVVAP